ncbi:uncharacterized protein [Argopecten irradians]|uniref:uncharacterized protein n=1 Tax=Argopecten irradians TaxID=31199 RepID=UPI00371BD4C4
MYLRYTMLNNKFIVNETPSYYKFVMENSSEHHVLKTNIKRHLEQSLQMMNTDKSRKYIVYDCSQANPGVCGGWSDRLSGILSTLVIAILTKRNFLIKHDKPCLLGDYLIPTNLLDWRYNKSMLINKTFLYQDLSARKSTTLRPYLRGKLDVTSYFKHDVDFLRINWDFTEEFRKRPTIGTEIPWMTKLHYADIYRQLFMSLFKPSPLFSDALNKFRNKRRRPYIACAHLRVGRNPNMPGDDPRSTLKLNAVWDYLNNLNKSTYDFFVASDAEHVKNIARNRFPTNIIDSPGKITHIDQSNGNDPSAGFLKQLLDFYTLLDCDVLITSVSGFSIFAAYLRGTDSGLYCLASGGLLPCSRYTINDIFPGEFLAPAI